MNVIKNDILKSNCDIFVCFYLYSGNGRFTANLLMLTLHLLICMWGSVSNCNIISLSPSLSVCLFVGLSLTLTLKTELKCELEAVLFSCTVNW